MIVVDTNVIVYGHLSSDHSSLAHDAFKRDPEWVAPGLWRYEFKNVLSRHIRRSKLTMDEALRAIQQAEKIVNTSSQNENRTTLTLTQSSGCTTYDCEFVAAAKTLGIPLVTKDSQVLKAFPETAISLVDFASPPQESDEHET